MTAMISYMIMHLQFVVVPSKPQYRMDGHKKKVVPGQDGHAEKPHLAV